MQRSLEMRGIFYELASKIRSGNVEQPLFHTVVQCLYLKREMVEKLMKAPGTSPMVRIHCELFLDWLGKRPHFPFDTAQSEDSLQEKIRVLSLEEQLFLFDALWDLQDAINGGDRGGLSKLLEVIGPIDNEE